MIFVTENETETETEKQRKSCVFQISADELSRRVGYAPK